MSIRSRVAQLEALANPTGLCIQPWDVHRTTMRAPRSPAARLNSSQVRPWVTFSRVRNN
jgi:hypothetical protein